MIYASQARGQQQVGPGKGTGEGPGGIGALGRERKMHPAAESRAPRLNGPKRGPGSHPALCSGLEEGGKQVTHEGPDAGRSFRLAWRSSRAPSPALTPRALRAGEPPAPLLLEVVPGPWPRTSPTHPGHAALAARGEAARSSSGTAALAGSPEAPGFIPAPAGDYVGRRVGRAPARGGPGVGP